MGYDAFICTLGANNIKEIKLMKKVEYEYPLLFANLAKELKVPSYVLLSCSCSNIKSWSY